MSIYMAGKKKIVIRNTKIETKTSGKWLSPSLFPSLSVSFSLSVCAHAQWVGMCMFSGHGAAVSPLQVPNWIMRLTSIRPSSVCNPPSAASNPPLSFRFRNHDTVLRSKTVLGLYLYIFFGISINEDSPQVRMWHAKDRSDSGLQSDNEWNRRNAVMSCQWRRSFFLFLFALS